MVPNHLPSFIVSLNVAIRNDWTPKEIAAYLLIVLQGQAADILHSARAEASYEDIVRSLQDRFGDHQLAAVYRSQIKARDQMSGETLQEFSAAVEQYAHAHLLGFPSASLRRRPRTSS
jgi:hypothetical protein